MISTRETRILARDLRLGAELIERLFQEVPRQQIDRTKTAALDENGTLVKDLGRLDDFTRRREHGRVGERVLDKPEAHQAVVDVGEGGSRELDHVDFDAIAGQVVQERGNEGLGFRMLINRAVKQVDPDEADRLPFAGGLDVVRGDVKDELRRLRPGHGLKADSQPAVAVRVSSAAVSGRGVRKSEKRGLVSA